MFVCIPFDGRVIGSTGVWAIMINDLCNIYKGYVVVNA